MRRHPFIVLLVALVFIAIVGFARDVWLRNQSARGTVATGNPGDSIARQDSAAQNDVRQTSDTMCIASRIGLPCDPR